MVSLALLAFGLFVSLFLVLYFLAVPQDEYSLSPAQAAVSTVKARLTRRFRQKEEALRYMGKSLKDVLRASLVVGLGLALLVFLLTVKFLGAFSLVLAVAAGVLGLFLVEKAVENAGKKYREKLLDGVPSLVAFFPAFLEVEGVTPKEALEHTVPFLPEPLRSEVAQALVKLKFRWVDEAVAPLVRKASHPLVDAVFLRMAAAWDAGITPEVFADLSDQVEDLKELAAARATAAKAGYLALVCVLGLLGVALVFGYPGARFLLDRLTHAFGG
ncbi:hypothetical protein [Ammonifex thiophilus]|uniref:Type II secretion system protein GspF domain-containing protein n=1 Tax=Ammonifex thiophilus TaxID=444093 RepID=A0A3D8P1A0_9THEO|nr:hypothetical protein [Ammonifex thiophilus]RDV81181.1 hypothetical protein DXX99_09830 [Ammonifex thiophilus]